jgi:hypothetical protein
VGDFLFSFCTFCSIFLPCSYIAFFFKGHNRFLGDKLSFCFSFLCFSVLKPHNRCYFKREINKIAPVFVKLIVSVINQRIAFAQSKNKDLNKVPRLGRSKKEKLILSLQRHQESVTKEAVFELNLGRAEDINGQHSRKN